MTRLGQDAWLSYCACADAAATNVSAADGLWQLLRSANPYSPLSLCSKQLFAPPSRCAPSNYLVQISSGVVRQVMPMLSCL